MANRTIATGDDVESGLSFLAKEKGVTGDEFFMSKVKTIMEDVLKEADSKRYAKAQSILSGPGDTAAKINELRELLNA